MDPLSIAQNIYKIAAVIYAQAQKVKANQKRCLLLAERVAAVESAIRKLGKLPDQDAFKQSLQRLEKCLIEMSEYMGELSGERWYKRFLKAGSHEGRFESFNQRLTLAIPELSLGLDAQALLNREADQKAAEADRAVLLSKQDEILRLNEALLVQVNKIPDAEFHRRQHESLLIRMDQLLQMVRESKTPVAAPSSPKSPSVAGLDPKITIPYFELALEAKIAQGTFGMIYRGRWHEQVVAIKVWDGRMSDRERTQFIRETQVLQHLNVPGYVPQFYGACLENGQACLVMEYYPLGSLDTALTGQPLSLMHQRAIALSLAKSLAFLHQRGVVHRYLKSANVLLKEETPGGLPQARVTGFGLSKTQYPSIVSAQLDLDELKAGLAPELLEGREATMAADVYSFGVILKEMATGRRALSEIDSGLEGLDPAVIRLIRSCCSADPAKRPEIKAVIETLAALPPPAPAAIPVSPGLAPPAAIVRPRTPTPASGDTPNVKTFAGGLSPPAVAVRPRTPPPAAAARPEAKTPGKVASPGADIPLSPAALGEPTAYERAKNYHAQKDFVNARKYYEIALNEGENKAQVKFAALLIRGDGGTPESVKADHRRAVELFKLAAVRGEVLAMQNLVKIFTRGVDGVPANPAAAADWQRQLEDTSPKMVQSALHNPQIRSGQAVSQASPVTVLGGGAKRQPSPSASPAAPAAGR